MHLISKYEKNKLHQYGEWESQLLNIEDVPHLTLLKIYFVSKKPKIPNLYFKGVSLTALYTFIFVIIQYRELLLISYLNTVAC